MTTHDPDAGPDSSTDPTDDVGPVFGAGIWHFATYVDRYATDGYGEPVTVLQAIDLAGKVGELRVRRHQLPLLRRRRSSTWQRRSCARPQQD